MKRATESIVSEARQRLSDDHLAVNEVLQQLLAALHNKNVDVSFAKLDLFWARLAVHIRAEHLHLFPAVMNHSGEAQPLIEQLRADHDFFMHELARAIGVLREPPSDAGLISVRDTVLAVEERLITHNEIEENQIYHWAGTLLTETEQTELAARINAELENRPPRFTVGAWANK